MKYYFGESDNIPENVSSEDSDWTPKKRKRKILPKEKDTNPNLKFYSSEEKKYYKNLPLEQKKYIKEIEEKVVSINDLETPLRFKILCSNIDENIKAICIKKLDYLCELEPSSGEYYKTSSWIDSVCRLPIGHYKSLSIDSRSKKQEIKEFLTRARIHMDTTVYGHNETKTQIVRLLAQWIVNPESKGMVIGIHGPMGCGKTTLIKDSICKLLDLPFAFIPLGGASDSAYLEGHSYTYEGATWGKIVDTLMKSKCMNPVFYFDELDKVSDTTKGEEIINILIHLTDLSQNDKFQDKFFTDFEFNLSKSLIIFSYNDETKINPILKDRMTQIETNGYNTQEKLVIARKHILPEIIKEYQFKEDEIHFSDEILNYIINKTDKEEGVRNFKRSLSCIISYINLKRITDENLDDNIKFKITKSDVDLYIKSKKNDIHLSSMYT